MPGILYSKADRRHNISMMQIRGDTELNHSQIKTEIIFRDRTKTSVVDNVERRAESQNSPN